MEQAQGWKGRQISHPRFRFPSTPFLALSYRYNNTPLSLLLLLRSLLQHDELLTYFYLMVQVYMVS